MAESSKKQPQTSRETERRQHRQRLEQIAERRTRSRKSIEREQQRRVLIVAGGALGLVLLVLLGGVLYDQVWVPSRPLARVDEVTLTRSDYWEVRRISFAQEIAQNIQLTTLFQDNPEISQQFAGRAPLINQQVSTIRSQPEEPQVIEAWQDRQITLQGAQEMGITASDTEINQRIVENLGSVFLPPTGDAGPPTDPITDTDVLTDPITDSEGLTDTDVLTDPITDSETLTDNEESDLEVPTPTDLPTSTPLPTPQPEEAAAQVPQIIDAVYTQYTTELDVAGIEPELTLADFEEGLRQQAELEVVRNELRETLVPEDEFEPSSEPDLVEARQIFLDVETSEDMSAEERDEAYEERLAEAEELAEELRDGADFAELAEEHSDDPGSREQGGSLGFLDEQGNLEGGNTLPPELVETAFELAVGEISDPIRTQFGWHIIEVTERDIPSEEEQLREARSQALEEWQEEQRSASTVQRFPEPTATLELEPGELQVPLDGSEPPAERIEPAEQPTPVPTFVPGPPTAQPTPEPGAPGQTQQEFEVPPPQGAPEIEVVPENAPEIELVPPDE